MFWKKWYFDKCVEFGLLLWSFEWFASSYKRLFKLLHLLLYHIDLQFKHTSPYQLWFLLRSMTVACCRKRAQAGLNQNFVSGFLVGRVPLEGGSEECLWAGFLWREVSRTPCGRFLRRLLGGGAAENKKNTIYFFFWLPFSFGSKAVIQPIQQIRPIWPIRPIQPIRRSSRACRSSQAGRSSRAGRSDGKKGTTNHHFISRRNKRKNRRKDINLKGRIKNNQPKTWICK